MGRQRAGGGQTWSKIRDRCAFMCAMGWATNVYDICGMYLHRELSLHNLAKPAAAGDVFSAHSPPYLPLNHVILTTYYSVSSVNTSMKVSGQWGRQRGRRQSKIQQTGDRRSFAQLCHGKHQQKTCIYLRLSTECEVQLFTINSKLLLVLCMKMCHRMRTFLHACD